MSFSIIDNIVKPKDETFEGAKQYESTDDLFLDFISKAGSAYVNRKSFYAIDSDELFNLFKACWNSDKINSLKLLFWLRDRKEGAGNRSFSRLLFRWVAKHDPAFLSKNLKLIPFYGRWDDLRFIFNSPLEKEAAELWAREIKNNNVIAAKWADRKDKPLQKELNLKESQFRKLLASIRSSSIVEHKLTTKKYNDIIYSQVPSIAMARYANAFHRNDAVRFNSYIKDVKKGVQKVNTSVLYPHDCMRTLQSVIYSDEDCSDVLELANLQFNNLPKYIDPSNRILTIADLSGSMCCYISGSVRAIDISVGLALYTSSSLNSSNPFYKKFIIFSNESEIIDWKDKSFSDAAIDTIHKYSEYMGSTNISEALLTILRVAKQNNVTNNEMPNALLIVSDMQFSSGCNSSETEVERTIKLWKKEGFTIPKIIYWNVSTYEGSPCKAFDQYVNIISGFNPSNLKHLLTNLSITPKDVVTSILEKYTILV